MYSEIELFTPYEKQLEVIEACEDPSLTYIVCVAGRQSGKTTMGENLALKWCLDEKCITVIWISPTDSQAAKVYKEIVEVIGDSKVVKTKKAAKGDIEIVFANGSKILFRSAGSKDTLRGNRAEYIILDEAAMISVETITEIILPMLTVTGRKLLALSTPKGKNYFYDWYLKGQEYNTKWKSFRFTCYDNPYANSDIVEGNRDVMTDVKFNQEYLCHFVDSASVFKNIEDCATMNALNTPIVGQSYYAGVDIGLLNDASVLTIIDRFGNMVGYYRWEEPEAQDVIDNIIEINRIWRFKKILFETNNHGMPMYQTLKKQLNNIQDINTSTKTKPQMINRLIYLFDTRQIRVLKDELLRIELEAFNYKVSDAGNVKYGAASGHNDDMVMSLAIARECYERGKYNSRFIGFF